MSKKITNVEVILDDNVPEYMDGIMRCGTVRSIYDDGTSVEHNELIDNTEYKNKQILKEDIARRIGVKKDLIEVLECNMLDEP
jgi:hypothetical protein